MQIELLIPSTNIKDEQEFYATTSLHAMNKYILECITAQVYVAHVNDHYLHES